MKKLLYILLASFAFLCVSCKDDCNMRDNTASFEIKSAKMNFDFKGGKGVVVTNAKHLNAVSSASWLRPIVNGSVVNLIIESNPSYEARTAVLTLSVASDKKTIPVTQLGILNIVSLSDFTFSEQGGVRSFPFSVSGAYEVKIDSSWLSYKIKDNQLILTCDSSKVEQERSTNCTVKAGLYEKTFVFTQLAYISPKYYNSLIGDYTLEYSLLNGSKKSVDVSLQAKEVNSSYVLKGLGYDLIIDFDKHEKSLSIYTQDLPEFTKHHYMFYAFAGPPTYSFSTQEHAHGMKAVESDEDGSTKFVFTDNGATEPQWEDETGSRLLVQGFVAYTTDNVPDGEKIPPTANPIIMQPVLIKK